MPGGQNQPVLKPWTRNDCINGAKQQLLRNNMSCGTNPSPVNAHCIRKNINTYNSTVKNCPQ